MIKDLNQQVFKFKCHGCNWSEDGVRMYERERATTDLVEEVVKPEPKYRPFASAEEFKPHRDKWIVPKSCSVPKNLCFKVAAYSDNGHHTKDGCIGWGHLFDTFQFEDGTPCGIKL